ncbi:beta-ketoacyl-ACP synthase II [bacterium]|nr:beta-ketoacyl-ACP synthase II [bacterium]MBU1154119.1 beta-ketoacyl-ACP synthase II [bacterium]MBU1782092.1 beta-ketoacyl-ACP synthase II [bacterium]
MQKRVVITGRGIISPLGHNLETIWESLIKGKSGVNKITSFDTSGYSSRIAATIDNFDPTLFMDKKDIKRTARFAQLAIAASVKAIQEARLDLEKEDLDQIGVYIGSGIGGLDVIEEEHRILLEKGPKRVTPFFIPMLIINIASSWVSIIYGFKGPNSAVVTACASGSHAIGDAASIIRRGDAEVMIAGGTEAAITPLSFAGFCTARALSTRDVSPEKASCPFDLKRDGFVMGEGAGIVVLESLEHALKRNASIYGEIIGYGLTGDAYHITSPSPDGKGAVRAMEMALRNANVSPKEVDYINAHGTSTKLNDQGETLAIKEVFKEHAHHIPINSTKSMIGHLLGAAGSVEFIVSLMCMEKKMVHPTINYEDPDPECDLDYVPNKPREVEIKVFLSNSFGFGGHNVCLVGKKYEDEG